MILQTIAWMRGFAAAKRFLVRITTDAASVPAGTMIAAGMTATIEYIRACSGSIAEAIMREFVAA